MELIAIYIPSLSGGGAERVILSLANGLAHRGVRVDLVLNKTEGPYLKDVSSKINIVNLNTSRVLQSIMPLSRYLNRSEPDIILSAMNYVNVATIIAHLISKSHTKVFLSEHSNFTETKKKLGPIKGFTIKSLMAWTYRKSNAVIAVSEGVADALSAELNLKRDKIVTIYNPVITDKLIKSSKHTPSHPWVTKKTKPFILSVGRLTDVKDFENLIRAFKLVSEEKPCNLVILGEGKLRTKLEKLINDLGLDKSVQLPGFVDNPYAWMSKADVFVLSSVQEGLPTALIEAMACGAQVVSTDCPSGPYEILEGGKWGKLVPPANSNLLAKAILESLETHKPIDVKTRAAFFSVDNAVDKYLDIFSK